MSCLTPSVAPGLNDRSSDATRRLQMGRTDIRLFRKSRNYVGVGQLELATPQLACAQYSLAHFRSLPVAHRRIVAVAVCGRRVAGDELARRRFRLLQMPLAGSNVSFADAKLGFSLI